MARGDELVALSRSGTALQDGTPTVAHDLATTEAPNALLAGASTVFHLAAIAHRSAPAADYEQLNYHATVALAAQAAAAGAACFVYLSSVRAMGPPNSSDRRSENDCRLPVEPYGLSKWRAECALRAAYADHPMSVVVLRPSLIYGAGVKGNLRLLARAVRRGLPRLPAGGRRSLIAVEDLVALMCCVADAPPPGAHTWIATGEDASTQQIVDALRAALGKRSDSPPVPRWIWRAAARAHDAIRRTPGLSSYEALFGTELYDNSAVRAGTVWRPRHTFRQAAAELLREPA
tara:strand:+ start:11668 stop:12537 length:870 start_codon:yes stop_codon:yes gene_type:complete